MPPSADQDYVPFGFPDDYEGAKPPDDLTKEFDRQGKHRIVVCNTKDGYVFEVQPASRRLPNGCEMATSKFGRTRLRKLLKEFAQMYAAVPETEDRLVLPDVLADFWRFIDNATVEAI